MKRLPILYNFNVQLPAHRGTHEYDMRWLATAHAKAEEVLTGGETKQADLQPRMEKLLRRFGCSPKHIGYRYSELDDFTHTDWQQMRIFNLEAAPAGRSIDVRNQFFAETVNRAVERFYAEESEPPTDLLHITCTGYASPSAIQRLIESRGWQGQTRATQIYHMGCYASLPALRVAAGLLNVSQDDRPPRADLIHTEMCTLHFNPCNHAPEQLVVQSLFADGHIRYSMTLADAADDRINEPSFAILATREEIVPESLEDMTWVLSDGGFRMTLSRDVPNKIAATLPPFLERLFASAGENYADVKAQSVFAIHPGGPRIIDSVQELLGLEEWQTTVSRSILFEHGNMSSATLPHIWAKTIAERDVKAGTLVASLAFGPGLTVAGALFRKR